VVKLNGLNKAGKGARRGAPFPNSAGLRRLPAGADAADTWYATPPVLTLFLGWDRVLYSKSNVPSK